MTTDHGFDHLDLVSESFDVSGDYVAGWCVDPDGNTIAWLICTADDADEQPCGIAPAHEQLGKLTGDLLVRIHGSLPRCGFPTGQDGHRCRIVVNRPDLRCRFHEEAAKVSS